LIDFQDWLDGESRMPRRDDTAVDTKVCGRKRHGVREALHLLATQQRQLGARGGDLVPKKVKTARPLRRGSLTQLRAVLSLGAIPSRLAPFLRVRVRADFRDENAAEAIPHL